MKVLLVVLSLAALGAAAAVPEPIERLYHENIGISKAARIKAAEEAQDFDGSRISGGNAARLGQFPYMAGLVIALTSGQTSMCGASVLSNTRLVTAAHCWRDSRNQARQFTVVLASLRLFSGGTRVNTNQVIVHGSWNPQTAHNDIAMIRINWVNFGGNINRINPASGSSNFVATWATAVGYGATGDEAGNNNQALHHVSLQVITNAICRQTFGNVVAATTICTSGGSRQSICRGDSGGPLAAPGPLLIGVASFVAQAGCQRNLPAGYARVTSFNAWIGGQM